MVLLTTTDTAVGLPPHETTIMLLDDPNTQALLDAYSDAPITDTDRTSPLLPAHPAYIIYTSGSTGQPKGVAMPAEGLTNLLEWHRSSIPGGPGTRTLQFTSISFDVSVQETMSALLSGKSLVIPPDVIRADPDELLRWCDEFSVHELYAPNVVVHLLCDAALRRRNRLGTLRTVAQAGEALTLGSPAGDVFRERRAPLLHNHYGPSETHVVTAYTLPDDAELWPRVAP
ncbi:AMP-binding protein, partial [Rugosimonospora africana]|uniref:AMP-binding protein n=1 Tax=Rugosimonospora africana TaxID=556532 RepID=UPI00194091F1